MARTETRTLRPLFAGSIMAALLALVAAGAFAFGPRHERGHPMSAELHEYMLNKMLDRVDATDEQRERITEIMTRAHEEVAALREGHSRHDLHEQMVELLTAETVDRTAIDALRFEHEQMMQAAMTRMTDAVVESAALLSREQRVAIADAMSERFGRHGEHRHHGGE